MDPTLAAERALFRMAVLTVALICVWVGLVAIVVGTRANEAWCGPLKHLDSATQACTKRRVNGHGASRNHVDEDCMRNHGFELKPVQSCRQ